MENNIKEIVNEAFELQDWIEGTKTGGIHAPRIIKSIELVNENTVNVSWINQETCGLSDCRYHNTDLNLHTDTFRLEDNILTVNGERDVFRITDWDDFADIMDTVNDFATKYGISVYDKSTYRSKYEWKYGDNGCHEYYDTTVDGTYLLVLRNHGESCWMCMVDNKMIYDKTRNDMQRAKQGLAEGCDISLLRVDAMLCSENPYKLIQKAEWCYEHNVYEIPA